MNRKIQAKSDLRKTIALRKKSRTAKESVVTKIKPQTRIGSDAATIRKEVLLVKEKLQKRQSFFEQMGSNDLLKSSND